MTMLEELLSALDEVIENNNNDDVIRNIYVNESEKVIVVVFKDGEKQIVKCSPDDEFDIEVGVALAIARYCFGSKTQFRKFIQKNAKFKKEKVAEIKKPKGGKK